MSNQFLVNLGAFPQHEEAALQLIEASFGYQKPESYAVDFFPLVQKENASHRWVLLQDNEVIGHIGVKEETLVHMHFDFKVIFIGGIAIKESERGRGHFQTMMEQIKNIYEKKVALMFLWSNKQSMYEKHGFSLCIGQIQVEGQGLESELEHAHFHQLHWEDKKRIRELYKKTLEEGCFTVKREKPEWSAIENIKSADFFLRRSKDRIIAYYVQNKGKDLHGIAHEFGFEEEKYLKEMIQMSSATFWLPEKYLNLYPEAPVQYGSMVKICHPDLFHDFVSVWSDGEINTLHTTNGQVKFLFQDEIFSLGHQEFLASLFGPYPLKEFQNFNKNLYISGLDSI